jgi:amino acid adenylation domain-containing protein
VRNINLVDPSEAVPELILEQRAGTSAVDLATVCIHQLIEAQVERTPDAVAVQFEDDWLTYRELNRRANQLAHHLRCRKVGPEVLVGLCVRRSLDMVVGLLGILKAGGAYVPLDPSYPMERLAFLIEDAQADVLITHERLRFSLPEQTPDVIRLDTDWPLIGMENSENLQSASSLDNLAYVIHTSGSTGKPKGVQVLHRGLVNLLLSMRATPGLNSDDVLLAVTTLAFDIAALELFLPLIVGARLVVASREEAMDGVRLAKKLADSGATVMQATPATWRLLVQSGWRAGRPFRKAFCGGEALPRKLANDLLDRGVSLWNLYGPTETTIWSTVYEVVSREGTVSIGRPVANTEVYVLDADLRPVPSGEPGELHLGGMGLASGYLNQPEQTAARFIPNPISGHPGDRLYKTGDLVRFIPDGNLEYLGRIDHQVKIRGYRIECGEIEAVMTQFPGVREAVVMAREDAPGDKRLVAYFVADPQAKFALLALRAFLKEKLPEYMVPSAFVVLAAFPLTANGKVDRRALPVPANERPELAAAMVPPRDECEARLSKLFECLLGVQPIGVKDNFFELGGDSLLAAHLMSQIRESFGQNLPLTVLVQEATVEHLARLLGAPTQPRKWPALVEIQPRGDKRPVFFAHGIGGEVLALTLLAQHLGLDQPFFGLRAHGTDGAREPFIRVEDMAANYLEEVLAVQSKGPFFLGGWSFGGIVAFEMARQLHARGHHVGLLFIIDQELVDEYRKYVWRPHWLLRFAHNIPRWVFHDVHEWSPRHRHARLWVKLGEVKDLLKAMLRCPRGGPSEWGVQQLPPDLSHYPPAHRRVWHANQQALMTYKPRVYPGRITVVRARVQPLISTFEHDLGWGRYAAGGVEVMTVPGYHSSVVKVPHVQALAARLKKALSKALAEN